MRDAARADEQLAVDGRHDHRELVHAYEQIGLLPERDRWDQLPARLLAFKSQLEAHLLAENVRFYNYVENSLVGDEENMRLIRDFRREMNGIARAVVDFVKKYHVYEFDDFTRKSFLKEYAVVGGLLAQRIQREESNLYPLYQPI